MLKTNVETTNRNKELNKVMIRNLEEIKAMLVERNAVEFLELTIVDDADLKAFQDQQKVQKQKNFKFDQAAKQSKNQTELNFRLVEKQIFFFEIDILMNLFFFFEIDILMNFFAFCAARFPRQSQIDITLLTRLLLA